MLYRFWVLVLFFIISYQAYGSTPVPAPLFLNLTKNYDLKNKQNLTLREKSKKGVQLAQENAVLDQEPDFWAGLHPTLTDGQKAQITEFKKINDQQEHNAGVTGGPLYQQQQQSDRLNNIKSDFFNHYLNDQLLNGWLVPTLKKANPSIENLEKGVKKLGDVGGDNKKPEAVASKAVDPLTPKEDEWKLEVGTRFDLLRQKGRGWFNCDLFNSEAQVDAGGFRSVSYRVNINKELIFSKDPSVPFHVVRAAVIASSGGQVGEISTKLSENLNLNYANEFNTHINSMGINYSIGF